MSQLGDLLKKSKFFNQNAWAVLDHHLKIVLSSALSHGQKSHLQNLLMAIDINSIQENQHFSLGVDRAIPQQTWSFKALRVKGENLWLGAVTDSPDQAEATLQMAVDLIGDEPILHKHQVFERLLLGKLQWQPQLIHDLELPKEGPFHLMAFAHAELDIETVDSLVEALDEPFLRAYIGGVYIMLTFDANQAKFASDLHQLLLEELFLQTLMVHSLQVSNMSNLPTCLNHLTTALAASQVYRPFQSLFDMKSLFAACAAYKQDINLELEPYLCLIESVAKDPELLNTVIHFLRYDLNLTDTSHALFIHRNTLIYRLNKIEQMTGFDIRKFDDANNFYTLLGLSKSNEKTPS